MNVHEGVLYYRTLIFKVHTLLALFQDDCSVTGVQHLWVWDLKLEVTGKDCVLESTHTGVTYEENT